MTDIDYILRKVREAGGLPVGQRNNKLPQSCQQVVCLLGHTSVVSFDDIMKYDSFVCSVCATGSDDVVNKFNAYHTEHGNKLIWSGYYGSNKLRVACNKGHAGFRSLSDMKLQCLTCFPLPPKVETPKVEISKFDHKVEFSNVPVESKTEGKNETKAESKYAELDEPELTPEQEQILLSKGGDTDDIDRLFSSEGRVEMPVLEDDDKDEQEDDEPEPEPEPVKKREDNLPKQASARRKPMPRKPVQRKR